MITVLLYGHLADEFGKEFQFDIKTPIDAVRALSANFPGFKKYLIKHSSPGYRFITGEKPVMTSDELFFMTQKTIKIVPVIEGAGGLGAIGEIILGAALIYFTAGMATPLIVGTSISVASIGLSLGVSMMLSGVATLFTGDKNNNQQQKQPVANVPSDVFNGAVNTTVQGNPVPVCYGRLVVGSQVLSSGLSAQESPL